MCRKPWCLAPGTGSWKKIPPIPSSWFRTFFNEPVADCRSRATEYPLNLNLYDVSVWVLPLIIAITFHEAAHAFVAHHFGDNTAWDLGRVSFNPLKHIDPFGTLILP